ncbi:MAG: hypothetical protein IPI67_22585 [Myxococcales bacterium]|nr:hypothetical protein [Myxococcales bacterium]
MKAACVCAALALVACQGPKTKECFRLVQAASVASHDVDAKRIESVEAGLKAVEAAEQACTEAGRDEEVKQLAKGRVDLAAHLERLKRKATDPARQPLSAEELAELVAKGDPHCPKGQGYKHSASGNEIRCNGPQVVEMNYAAARDYFDRRGYKLSDVEPAQLKAELGAESLVLAYQKPKDTQPPRCIIIYPPPDQSWQEAAARATGTRPDLLKVGGSITTTGGRLPIRLDVDSGAGPVRIGDCES